MYFESLRLNRVQSSQPPPPSSPLKHSNTQIVSDDSERLILVDAEDKTLGHLDKSSCHDGRGVLHRAFSLFIFNDRGELLLQQRARGKRLWPGYWSNSCCSHPREGETLDEAVQRRCEQELGFQTPMRFLYKFQYSAQFGEIGAENELCSIFTGVFNGAPEVNTTEISAWRWLTPSKIDQELATKSENFTPWFKMEWHRLKTDFAEVFYAT